MNLNEFDPEEYQHCWSWSWVEKTQVDNTRQKEYGWHIPSTDPIWTKHYYNEDQKQYHSKVLQWKIKSIDKIIKQNALEIFRKNLEK